MISTPAPAKPQAPLRCERTHGVAAQRRFAAPASGSASRFPCRVPLHGMHDGALPQVLFVDLAQGRGHRRRARPGHASARPSRLACGCWPRCASLEPLTCEATYAQVPGAAAAPEGALRAVRGRRLPPWTVTRPGAWFELQCGARVDGRRGGVRGDARAHRTVTAPATAPSQRRGRAVARPAARRIGWGGRRRGGGVDALLTLSTKRRRERRESPVGRLRSMPVDAHGAARRTDTEQGICRRTETRSVMWNEAMSRCSIEFRPMSAAFRIMESKS